MTLSDESVASVAIRPSATIIAAASVVRSMTDTLPLAAIRRCQGDDKDLSGPFPHRRASRGPALQSVSGDDWRSVRTEQRPGTVGIAERAALKRFLVAPGELEIEHGDLGELLEIDRVLAGLAAQ